MQTRLRACRSVQQMQHVNHYSSAYESVLQSFIWSLVIRSSERRHEWQGGSDLRRAADLIVGRQHVCETLHSRAEMTGLQRRMHRHLWHRKAKPVEVACLPHRLNHRLPKVDNHPAEQVDVYPSFLCAKGRRISATAYWWRAASPAPTIARPRLTISLLKVCEGSVLNFFL